MIRVIRNKSLFERLSFGNFKLFAFLAILALVSGLTYYLVFQRQNYQQDASNLLTTEYGFNTHHTITNWHLYRNLTPEFFRTTVDDLSSNGQKWIRFNILPGESGSLSSSQGVETFPLNQANMNIFLDSMKYAKSKGLKIFLVTTTPNFPPGYVDDTDYKNMTEKYHLDLANFLKGNVDVWQIYNEVDALNFKDYSQLSELTDEYLAELKLHFDLAKNAIKSVDPNVKITANVTGFPMISETSDRWVKFYDVMAPSLDILSFDIYPQKESEAIFTKSAIAGTASRYSKPFGIAETGVPTADGRYTEADQATLMATILEQVRPLNPEFIIYYQYSDTIPNTNLTESSFGIVRADGSKKSSYDGVMALMRTQPGLLRVVTEPPIGVTIKATKKDTNETVLVKEWGVSWEKLEQGEYILTFENPNNVYFIGEKQVVIPLPLEIPIESSKTTTIVADLQTGELKLTNPDGTTATITIAPTPTSSPTPTNSPTPSPTPFPTPTSTPTPTICTPATVKSIVNGKWCWYWGTYRGATVTCSNGFVGQVGSTTKCEKSSTLKAAAETLCKSKCN